MGQVHSEECMGLLKDRVVPFPSLFKVLPEVMGWIQRRCRKKPGHKVLHYLPTCDPSHSRECGCDQLFLIISPVSLDLATPMTTLWLGLFACISGLAREDITLEKNNTFVFLPAFCLILICPLC